jgi:hypothetical protein
VVVRLKKYHLERSQVFEPATGRFENLRPFKFPSTLSSMPRGMVHAPTISHLTFRSEEEILKEKEKFWNFSARATDQRILQK